MLLPRFNGRHLALSPSALGPTDLTIRAALACDFENPCRIGGGLWIFGVARIRSQRRAEPLSVARTTGHPPAAVLPAVTW